jgi:hypothetical protein
MGDWVSLIERERLAHLLVEVSNYLEMLKKIKDNGHSSCSKGVAIFLDLPIHSKGAVFLRTERETIHGRIRKY